jgi:hypothetical protein
MNPTTMATILTTGLPLAGAGGPGAAVAAWAAGGVELGLAVGPGAACREPQAVQKTAPCAIGFPQLVQNWLMIIPPNDFKSKIIQLR